MNFSVPRDVVINNIVSALSNVAAFTLVKPYEGEFYRFYLKHQMSDNTFPAEVNIATPFALVSSRSRAVERRRNRVMDLKHEISILVGIQNTHNFGNTEASDIFSILQECASALVGEHFHANASELMLDNDGVFLAKTDLFIIYEQQLFQYETANQ
jgi:hypothetical protein